MPYHQTGQHGSNLASLRTVLLCAFIALFAGCGLQDEDAEKPAAKKELKTKSVLVELASVKRGQIEEILERSSALEAEAQVQVLARTQNPAIELLV